MYHYVSTTMHPMSAVRRVTPSVTALLISLSILFAACSSDETADKKAKVNDQTPAVTQRDTSPTVTRRDDGSLDIKYTPPKIPVDLNGTPVEVAGARFVPDTKWEDLGSSGEMVAHYRYGPLEEDTEQAEVTVFLFEKPTNDYEKIMERWMDQISFADGRDARTSARRHDRQVGGMTAHVLSMDGIYTPASEGFDKEDGPVKDYYRLVGVVIEAPGGNIYFKLTGPGYTGRVMIDQFMNMIYRVAKT